MLRIRLAIAHCIVIGLADRIAQYPGQGIGFIPPERGCGVHNPAPFMLSKRLQQKVCENHPGLIDDLSCEAPNNRQFREQQDQVVLIKTGQAFVEVSLSLL